MSARVLHRSSSIACGGWGADLNATIGQAVTNANAEPASERNGADFTFINPVNGGGAISSSDSHLFEPTSGLHHEPRSPGYETWLNGSSIPKVHSYHPNQAGDTAMGHLAAEVIAELSWSGAPWDTAPVSAPADLASLVPWGQSGVSARVDRLQSVPANHLRDRLQGPPTYYATETTGDVPLVERGHAWSRQRHRLQHRLQRRHGGDHPAPGHSVALGPSRWHHPDDIHLPRWQHIAVLGHRLGLRPDHYPRTALHVRAHDRERLPPTALDVLRSRELAEAHPRRSLVRRGRGPQTPHRHLEISEQTWHRWRNQYGGMKADDAKRLNELEKENARLKKLLAEAELDKSMLKELAEGNF